MTNDLTLNKYYNIKNYLRAYLSMKEDLNVNICWLGSNKHE